MSRMRLEERTGVVESLGPVVLENHAHDFSHHGRDGTAKGNIEVALGELVRGVLYRLRLKQVELLHPFEGGYNQIDVQVRTSCGAQEWRAYTYMAPKDADDLLPQDSYLEHYLRGMKENQFPLSYVEFIRRQAGA